ncbi:DUF1643 domain-containing protein [Arcanobacterium phocae]|uniref:DUF1643 domain-containing protein n=1 Tax=Arcanobacterium phocae TaxID=131112 RepID=UPI001C0E9095|nr:DUF1643 domain-containing protein [Arcanobacterium phocae]
MKIDREHELAQLSKAFKNDSDVAYSDVKIGKETIRLRWFLRHRTGQDGNRLLFIGMNPGKAVRFEKDTSARHGDGTTKRSLEFLDCLSSENNPYSEHLSGTFSEATIVNLIPVVKGKSQDVPKLWNSFCLDDQHWILNSTLDLIEHFGLQADFVIPMWGNYQGNNSWKIGPAQHTTCRILSLPNHPTILVARNADGSPRHIKPLGVASQEPWAGVPLEPFSAFYQRTSSPR